MLVESVVNAKSIALVASEAASNQIPYLGLGFFPEEKKSGIDLRWIKTSKGVSPILAPSNFDALPVIRSREGIKIENTQMPFFREAMQITERDMIDIARIENESDPYLASALRGIYDDTTNLVQSAEVVGEIMRMQLLSAPSGHPSIGISADNVTYAYNYDPTNDYSTNNYESLSGQSDWSDTTHSKPLDDINDAKQALINKGYAPAYILMNSATLAVLRSNDQIKSVALTTNAAGVIYMSDALVKQIVKDATGLTIITYDKTYKAADGTAAKYYPDGQVTLLPAGPVGKTWFGTTPAERSIGQVTDGSTTSIYGTGIAVTTEPKFASGVYKFQTTVSEIVLPSFELMDATYVIKAIQSMPSA